jgi:uncharacterized protein (UPF0264 family)
VTDLDEATLACEVADVVDIKDPRRGSLGRADDETLSAVLAQLHGQVLLSCALGELSEPSPPTDPAATYLKIGLAGCGDWPDWAEHLAERWRAFPPLTEPVAVAYADWQLAGAPSPEAVLKAAIRLGGGMFLVDTWTKTGAGLFDFLTPNELQSLIDSAHRWDCQVAVAGSLRLEQLPEVVALGADLVAVRGGVCRGGRLGRFDSGLARQWRMAIDGISGPMAKV